MSVVFGVFFAA